MNHQYCQKSSIPKGKITLSIENCLKHTPPKKSLYMFESKIDNKLES